MTLEPRKIIVALYLRGSDLNPTQITSLLGVPATRSHSKGEQKITAAGSSFVTRTGVWALESDIDLATIQDGIRDIISQIGMRLGEVMPIPGVSEAYIDIYVCQSESDGNLTSNICAEDLAWMGAIGLSINLTFASVET